MSAMSVCVCVTQSGLSLADVAGAAQPIGARRRRGRQGQRRLVVDSLTRLSRRQMLTNMSDTSAIRRPRAVLIDDRSSRFPLQAAVMVDTSDVNEASWA